MRNDMPRKRPKASFTITDKLIQRISQISKEMGVSDAVVSQHMGISTASFNNYFRSKSTPRCRLYISQKIESFIEKYDAKKAEEAEVLKLEKDGNK